MFQRRFDVVEMVFKVFLIRRLVISKAFGRWLGLFWPWRSKRRPPTDPNCARILKFDARYFVCLR
jgi:hypothetical protein